MLRELQGHPFAAAVSEPTRPEVVLDDALSATDFALICHGESTVRLSPAVHRRLAQAEARLQHVIADERLVYGITTGFGPLANRTVSSADIKTLQTTAGEGGGGPRCGL